MRDPALCADTPSCSAGGAACSACPTRSLSGDKHVPTPPSPPPPPHRRPGLRGLRGLPVLVARSAAAPRPGRSGSCRRTCPPGRGEARQTMGLRGRGAARGWRSSGRPGGGARVRESPRGAPASAAGQWGIPRPGARRPPLPRIPWAEGGAPRGGFARKSQCLPPGDDTEARFGSLTGPVVLGCAIFRFCPWPFKQLSAPPGTL